MRVYIEVSGGCVQTAEGTDDWVVIDWDAIKDDPVSAWEQFDAKTLKYIKWNYPKAYAEYFAALEVKS